MPRLVALLVAAMAVNIFASQPGDVDYDIQLVSIKPRKDRDPARLKGLSRLAKSLERKDVREVLLRTLKRPEAVRYSGDDELTNQQLDNDDADLRISIVQTLLTQRNDADFIDAIIDRVSDDYEHKAIRQACIVAIDRIGSPARRVIPTLIGIVSLHKSSSSAPISSLKRGTGGGICEAALLALGSLFQNGDDVSTLIDSLQSQTQRAEERSAALKALAHCFSRMSETTRLLIRAKVGELLEDQSFDDIESMKFSYRVIARSSPGDAAALLKLIDQSLQIGVAQENATATLAALSDCPANGAAAMEVVIRHYAQTNSNDLSLELLKIMERHSNTINNAVQTSIFAALSDTASAKLGKTVDVRNRAIQILGSQVSELSETQQQAVVELCVRCAFADENELVRTTCVLALYRTSTTSQALAGSVVRQMKGEFHRLSADRPEPLRLLGMISSSDYNTTRLQMSICESLLDNSSADIIRIDIEAINRLSPVIALNSDKILLPLLKRVKEVNVVRSIGADIAFVESTITTMEKSAEWSWWMIGSAALAVYIGVLLTMFAASPCLVIRLADALHTNTDFNLWIITLPIRIDNLMLLRWLAQTRYATNAWLSKRLLLLQREPRRATISPVLRDHLDGEFKKRRFVTELIAPSEGGFPSLIDQVRGWTEQNSVPRVVLSIEQGDAGGLLEVIANKLRTVLEEPRAVAPNTMEALLRNQNVVVLVVRPNEGRIAELSAAGFPGNGIIVISVKNSVSVANIKSVTFDETMLLAS